MTLIKHQLFRFMFVLKRQIENIMLHKLVKSKNNTFLYLKFKFIYLKEIHSATLSSLLQKFRYIAADSWLYFAKHARWRRRGARELRLFTGACLGYETTKSKMGDGGNWRKRRNVSFVLLSFLIYYEFFKYNPHVTL